MYTRSTQRGPARAKKQEKAKQNKPQPTKKAETPLSITVISIQHKPHIKIM